MSYLLCTSASQLPVINSNYVKLKDRKTDREVLTVIPLLLGMSTSYWCLGNNLE